MFVMHKTFDTMNSTYIIGLILVAAVVVPMALLNRKKNKKNAAIKVEFSALTKTAIIANQEQWNGHIIAIDKIEKKCFFVYQDEKSCNSQSIDLTQYASCRVVTSSSMGSSTTSVEMVELVFSPKIKDAESISFVFFDAEKDGFTLNGELQIAERWRKYCADCMK